MRSRMSRLCRQIRWRGDSLDIRQSTEKRRERCKGRGRGGHSLIEEDQTGQLIVWLGWVGEWKLPKSQGCTFLSPEHKKIIYQNNIMGIPGKSGPSSKQYMVYLVYYPGVMKETRLVNCTSNIVCLLNMMYCSQPS